MTGVDNRLTGVTTPVSTYTYTYNELGQRATRAQTGSAIPNSSTDTFTYDGLGQIDTVDNSHYSGSAYEPDYNFDDIGNRTGDNIDKSGTIAYSPDLLNQYDSVDGVLYDDPANNKGYDLDGNFLGAGTWIYTWNGENRLISATNGTTTINFTYDYQGRLVEKDDGSNVEVYLYDGWNRIATFRPQVSALIPHKTYLWGMDLSGSMQGAGGVGGLLKEGSLYPTYDANGNIVQKLNSSGVATMEVEYDPFGNIISGSLVGEYGFSTKPLIDGIQMYYYGFRYYDPVTGRWPSRDPIGERGGLNLFGFNINDALNRWDILGLTFRLIRDERAPGTIDSDRPNLIGWTGMTDEGETGSLRISGESDTTATIEEAPEQYLEITSYTPSGIAEGYDADGMAFIVGHENRRVDVYRNAYYAYLRPQKTELEGRSLCCEEAGRAHALLSRYASELRASYNAAFGTYVQIRQANIESEVADRNIIIDQETGLISGSNYIAPVRPATPPSDLPQFPTCDDSIN